ncbi:MAG: DUF971 domain-containing protein [Gammaproteobacteria bacterium]|nr:DUF971 domain-containing protein [Gammaproteobacteria bacterium]
MTSLSEIRLHQVSKTLEIAFEDGSHFTLPCEYLRVFSPSAEVQGHGLAEPKLVLGKENVSIIKIEPVGHYALRLYFDDGHHTGLYTFEYLFDLGKNQTHNWQYYLNRLDAK